MSDSSRHPDGPATIQVVVRKGASVIRTQKFPVGKTLSIGRHPLNDIHLEDPSSKVSRFHVALFSDGWGQYSLQDLGSRNGTRVDKRRTDYGSVVLGNVVGVGDYNLTLEAVDKETSSKEYELVANNQELGADVKTIFSPLSLEPKDITHFENDANALSLLYKLSRCLSLSLDIRDTLGLIVQELVATFSPDKILIAEIRAGGTSLSCLGRYPLHEDGIEVSRTMIDCLLAEKRPLITDDALADERFKRQGSPSKSIQEQGTHAAVSVPLEWEGQINGILYMDSSTRKGMFSERDLNLLVAVARDLSSYLALGFQYHSVKEEKAQIQSRYDVSNEVIGISPKTKQILKSIERLRKTDATVLLTGETGTGKEVVARAIHQSSKRRGKPHIEVNCAAIADNLLESELFGVIANYPGFHNKQALVGKFELASGGTLFLDEIGELPLPLQAKLLRVLDDKKIWPLGRNQALPVDIRIVAATNRDLETAVHENRFRQDLYERLNVFRIHIPPLRERKEDIPLLSGYFLSKLRRDYEKRVTRFSNHCIEALSSLDWPGNIRQLKNSIERAIIQADGPVLTHDLFEIQTAAAAAPCSLSDAEREHIMKVLDYARGNKQKAARILGIAKQTLYKKGEEYNLPGFGHGSAD